jgi:TIR domain
MSSLADLPELVGFFSYSREDDEDSYGALSALRTRIQGGLRGQLGRTAKAFRLWQDKEAIPSGALWESEIKNAVAQSVFFIPIITPTVVASSYCNFELQSFLEREAELGRADLVFPILYIDVPALEDASRRQNDPVLSLIAERQYVDWREFQYLDIDSTEVKRQVGRFCIHIRDALQRPWFSPEERKQQEAQAALRQAEAERERQDAEVKRRNEEARTQAEEAKAREQAAEADAERQRAEDQRLRQEAEARRPAPQPSAGSEAGQSPADSKESSKLEWRAELSEPKRQFFPLIRITRSEETHTVKISSSTIHSTISLDDKIIYRFATSGVHSFDFAIGSHRNKFRLRFYSAFWGKISSIELWIDDQPLVKSD